MRTIAFAAASLLLVCACVTDDTSVQPGNGADLHPLGGTYSVVSHFDVPAAAAAPGPLGDALGIVHGLAENPGGAILDLAEDAGVPALGTLRAVLPDSLESELESWMNEYLEAATVGGTSPHGEIVALDGLIRSVLLEWDLESELRLQGPEAGTHAPEAIAFDALGERIVIAVDATAPITAATGVNATLSLPDGGAATVSIGDHAMGVPFGHYALEGLGLLLEDRWGAAGVRDVLGSMVDCTAMAESVGARCVGFLCVGHEAEIASVCEGGLDRAASQIESRILAIDYQAIRLQAGAAAAEGVSLDAVSGIATATRLDGGLWNATVDLGQGAEEATATFAADAR